MVDPLFYSETLPEAGATFTLAGDETHHARAARRLHTGDTLWLFDGHGGVARATLQQITKHGRELALRAEERRTEPPPKPSIHLACALPKGDRAATLLDMTTQLGMTRFTPLRCERSAAKPGAGRHERWRRICLEACKQSRRFYLPLIQAPATPQAVTKHAAARQSAVWIAHPAAQAIPVSSAMRQNPSADITLLVGPEGGFTEAEIGQAVAAGAKLLALGSAILRIETAAVALLAAFRLAGAQGPERNGPLSEEQ